MRGRKKESGEAFSLLSLLAPSPLPLTGPISSSLRRKFQHGASKLRAQRKRLHCRLERLFVCFVIVGYSFPEERSRASNQGVFLIFTVLSGRRFLFSLLAPSPLPLTGPISSSLRRKFQHGASKLRAQRKRLHCRLERLFVCFVIVGYSFPEERSRASNQGVFLIFTVLSGRRFLFSLLAPSPLPLTGPISSSLRRKFQHGASKLRAQRKRLHCRLDVFSTFQFTAKNEKCSC